MVRAIDRLESGRLRRQRTRRTVARSELADFLDEVMRRRHVLPSQLAADLGISHATVSRWLSGKDTPSVRSCQRLAEYTGEAMARILSVVGHLPGTGKNAPFEWPDFRQYAREKYADELDEDMISMIEDLIERRRARKYQSRTPTT